MILEQIEGNVKITFAGKTLVIGDTADDYSKAISVVGAGKAIFRVDPNCTLDINGAMPETFAPVLAPAPAPAPVVEAAPIAERVTPAMETPGEDTKA